jgi:LAO/AO transport system kinase
MSDSMNYKSALAVNQGVEQPPVVSLESVKRFKGKRRKDLTADELVEGILSGNRTLLSQAITLVESAKAEHQEKAQEIIARCLPSSGNSIRIGITGVPGVGKSTFIESLGKVVTHQGRKLAVLAIDPSSERSKGSILGDKTRMEDLANDPDAYIRPSPSAGSLGGVARKTRESIILCEAAGFDTIFIETVGVGQSETAVHSMVDFFLLLMLAGAGDELQGIKRGIMEMADALAITKADGSNTQKADLARAEYASALHLFPPSPSGWSPKVLVCSSLVKSGIPEIWDTINEYARFTIDNGWFISRRREQAKYWMYQTIHDELREHFYKHTKVSGKLAYFEDQVLKDQLSSFVAAKELLSIYHKK